MTVGELTDEHQGAHARITLNGADTREGTLTRANNPSYRRTVRHWWLVVPSTHPHFTHDALSLQWSESAPVELL